MCQKIISSLELGLDANSSLDQVINKLKILLDKDPVKSLQAQLTETNGIVEELRQQLVEEKDKPTSCAEIRKDLAIIEKTLIVRDNAGKVEQIKLDSYRLTQSNIIKIKSNQRIERSIFIVLLIGSLMTIAGLG